MLMRNHHYFGESTRKNETLRVHTSRHKPGIKYIIMLSIRVLKRFAISGTLSVAGADLPRVGRAAPPPCLYEIITELRDKASDVIIRGPPTAFSYLCLIDSPELIAAD